MSKITKPDLSIRWAQAGSVVSPTDVKKQAGWTAEKPEFEYMNWLQFRQDTGIAYAFQLGIPEWDSNTEYQYASGYASYVQYNGIVYKAIQTGTNKTPTTETAYWTRAFDDYGAASTVNSALTSHITNYGTLAGLTNVATARSNLSVYSIAQCNAAFAPITGNSGQTFSVATATNSAHAITKAQFDAKTGQATESTAGIGEVATNAEAAAGGSDTVFVTPLKLKYVLDNRQASETVAGVAEIATQVETNTGTDDSRIVTPKKLSASPVSAKAWVLFDGTGTILKSYNVSTVVRNSQGDFTITFTTAMADANYVVGGSARPATGTLTCVVNAKTNGAYTASAVDIQVWVNTATPSLHDASKTSVFFFD